MRAHKLLALSLLFLLAACASFTDVQQDKRVDIGGRFSVAPQVEWANVQRPGFATSMWTINGPGLDELYFFAGVKSGLPLFKVRGKTADEMPKYKDSMLPTDVMELTVSSLSKFGDLQVTAGHLAPAPFGSVQGYRFDLTFATADGLEMRGMALGAQRGGSLDLILFLAPSEHYFAATQPIVERIFASIQLPAGT